MDVESLFQGAPAGVGEEDIGSGEELAGTSLVDLVDELLSVSREPLSSRELLRHALSLVGLGGEQGPGGQPWSPGALFDGLRQRGAQARRLHEVFEVVAAPGSPLVEPLQPGDLFLRRPSGEGHLAHVALLVDGSTLSVEEARGAGLRLEHARPGRYAQVVEGGARPHGRSDRFARLVVDAEGRVPVDQMVVRLQRSAPGAAEESAEDSQVESALRTMGFMLLVSHLPCDYPYSDPKGYAERCYPDRFQRITDGKWGPTGPGTTCGYLTSWYLWALGCRDARTINRDDKVWNAAHPKEKDRQLVHTYSMNIRMLREDHGYQPAAGGGYSKVAGAAKEAWLPWRKDAPERRPKTGDVVHIIGKPTAQGQDTSHVFVFLDELQQSGETYWLTADGGQTSPARNRGSFMCFNLRKMEARSNALYNGERWLTGWLDPTRLPAQSWTWSGGLPRLDEALMNVAPAPWPRERLGSTAESRFAAQERARTLAARDAFRLLTEWPYPRNDDAAERMRTWVLDFWKANSLEK